MTETALVSEALTVLSYRHVVAFRVNQGAMPMTDDNGKRRFIRFTYGRDGVSDIIGCLPNGKFLAAEAKAPDTKRKATPQQAAFLAAVNARGGLGIVFRSVAELLAAIDTFLASPPPQVLKIGETS